MTRPDHLVLVAVVYGLGVLIATGSGSSPDPRAVWAGLVVVLAVASSIHLANEFADQDTDALSRRTPFSGGSGARRDVDVPARLVLSAVVVSAALAMFLGVVAVANGLLSGWATAIIAVAAVLGWQYSLPPLALSRRGWGEVTNAVLGGLLLPHAGAAVVAPPDLVTCVAVLPFTLLVFANLLATQWPDRFADAAVGKFTLATRWRPHQLHRVHRASIVAAAVGVVTLPAEAIPPSVLWGSIVVVPVAVWALVRPTGDDQPLPTVALMVVFVAVMVVGWGHHAGLA